MQIINKYNEEIPFLLRVINIISKYACVVTLNNNQKALQLTMHFKKVWMNLVRNQTHYG